MTSTHCKERVRYYTDIEDCADTKVIGDTGLCSHHLRHRLTVLESEIEKTKETLEVKTKEYHQYRNAMENHLHPLLAKTK